MLDARIREALARYLPTDETPFAVAASGGGDSVALLLALRPWAGWAHVMIVDHGLQAGSDAVAARAREQAEALGFTVEVLTPDVLPIGNLQAEARRARYGVMGERCRDLGLQYLVTAHTQTDQAETMDMRGHPIWPASHAPVWPGLRGVSVLRPALGVSREDMRDFARSQSAHWHDDPANADRRFARVKSREALSCDPERMRGLLAKADGYVDDIRAEVEASEEALSRVEMLPCGVAWIGRDMPSLAWSCLIAAIAGISVRPSADRVEAALSRDTATLGGAILIAGAAGRWLGRDPVAAKGRMGRGVVESMPLHNETLWDGRLQFSTVRDGLSVRPALGHLGRLPQTRDLPPPLRQTLPLITVDDAPIGVAGIDEIGGLEVLPTALARARDQITAYLRAYAP